MTFQTQCVISFERAITNCSIVIKAPVQQTFVANWFPFDSLPLVFRVDGLAEVLGV
jgi:hypothetical protein